MRTVIAVEHNISIKLENVYQIVSFLLHIYCVKSISITEILISMYILFTFAFVYKTFE